MCSFFGALCISGCGNQSCETVECGNISDENGTMTGVSIPGCGSCFNGMLCQGVLCAQSYKVVTFSGDEVNMLGIDTRYASGSCGGCGAEDSCYSGCVSYDYDESSGFGCFYGDSSSDDDEKLVGCINGGMYCGNSENLFGVTMFGAEYIMGID